ncbi:MAG: hypothetical protein LC799_04810, partial [Actinobacteria bacterium]|nr:hypothetical protein [Actinomycetota bacterium]
LEDATVALLLLVLDGLRHSPNGRARMNSWMRQVLDDLIELDGLAPMLAALINLAAALLRRRRRRDGS